MPSAKYTILVPSHPPVAQAVYEYLSDGPVKTDAINVIPGNPWTQIYAWAEDIPEVDSHMKQIGTYAAQAVNVPSLTVMKDGKNGVSTWEMRNTQYNPTSVHDELHGELTNQGDQGGSGGYVEDQSHHDSVPEVATESTGVPTPSSGDGIEEQMLDVGHQGEPMGTELE
jgi:hypothetical protein